MKYLGIDLGGINVAAAVVEEDGTIQGRGRVATPRSGAEAVAAAMSEAVRQAVENTGCTMADIASVGIGAPGVIDPREGVVEYWSNLDFHHVPLVSMLEQRLGKSVCIENDANAAALGEYAAGAGKGSTSMIAITLGTGVGGGAVLDGKLYTGFNYAGLEVGHFVVEYNGRLCTCGRRGCFETYASATALIKRTKELMLINRESLIWQVVDGEIDRVEGRTPFEAAARGDLLAKELVEEYQSYLACGITSLINIFQPEVFCVGGGVAGAGETLLGPVRAIVDREDYARDSARRTILTLAQLGNDAGIIGAALLPLFR
ncbi:ROK family protein [Pseudoflavonifractor phocaeensis]|uniref:ROK family protein n=1 Tax=Pseudoflavonifractor phocaeensis TaxID=1870988 RepID=UPI002108A709|nr:ROK family protein [Pseudoflavonifractor phocaeensis]MCQ4865422.1 ROK family protein [Pseudoflavonifractor phocaeensis]